MTDPWEELTTKQATRVYRACCDHPGCNEYNDMDHDIASPLGWETSGWRNTKPEDVMIFCPKHKNIYCTDDYIQRKDAKYKNIDYDFNTDGDDGCGRKLNKYGECNSCERNENEIEQNYANSWGFGKKATRIIAYVCDHPGCNNYIEDSKAVKNGWGEAYSHKWSNPITFCSEHKHQYCIKRGSDKTLFYYGCGELLNKYNKCNDCEEPEQKTEQEYSDSWGFGKKASRFDDVIGYVYDSDIHCLECTHQQFKDTDNLEDSEGNPISPMFREHDFDYKNDICGGCGTPIYEDECHHCGETTPGYQLESSPYKHTWGMVCHDCLLKDPHIEERDDYCNKCGKSNIFIKGSKNCLNCDKGKLDPHNIGMLGQCLQCDGSDEELYSDSWGFGKKASTFHHCDHQDQTGTCKNIAQYDDEDELYNWSSDSFYDTKHHMVHIGNDRHYCPEHKNLYCRQCNIPMQKEDIADGYTECFNCHNCNDNIGKYGVCQRCIPNEDFEEEYTDAWGFGKKASYEGDWIYCDHPCCDGIEHADFRDDTGWESAKANKIHFCIDHAPLHCTDDWDWGNTEFLKVGCGDKLNVGKYGQCVTCEGSDKKIEKEYSDGWGFGKKALNYFSLDQPNEAIMPGMAQNEPNPDSGMEDGVTQDFPGMHDYERGLSAAASKENDLWSEDDDLGLQSEMETDGGTVAQMNKIPKCYFCEEDASFDANTDVLYGGSNSPWAYMCTPCWMDKSDGKLGWGKGQRIVQASFEKVIFCDDCGDPDPDLGEYVNKNWGRASLNGFSKDDPKNPTKYDDWQELHFCPNCKEGRHLDDNINDPFKMTFGCGSKMNSFGECSQCFGDDQSYVDDYASGWGFNKKAMWDEDNYHFRCDECLKIGGVEGEEDKAHDKGWMMDYGLMYCPNCFENKICHNCWNPKLDTSFNQCKYCQGDDEEYKQSYSNGWGFNA